MRRVPALLALVLVWCGWISCGWAAGQTHLTADVLRYDAERSMVAASGDVRVSAQGGVLTAERGWAKGDGGYVNLSGAVSADWPNEELSLLCQSLEYVKGTEMEVRVSGGVELRHAGSLLIADNVRLSPGTPPRYSASGDIQAVMGEQLVEADSFIREGNQWRVDTLRRYVDREESLTVSAAAIEGEVDGTEITDFVASGGIRLRVDRPETEPVEITGERCVYSIDRGTTVITGGAHAEQGKRSISAESIVYHMDSRRIEAIGKPQLTFPLNTNP
ncbi:MAG: LptA/OstA family protein [Synergistales bacterium]|nr:LptA/OstA family protein [Synergistales bacterium]